MEITKKRKEMTVVKVVMMVIMMVDAGVCCSGSVSQMGAKEFSLV